MTTTDEFGESWSLDQILLFSLFSLSNFISYKHIKRFISLLALHPNLTLNRSSKSRLIAQQQQQQLWLYSFAWCIRLSHTTFETRRIDFKGPYSSDARRHNKLNWNCTNDDAFLFSFSRRRRRRRGKTSSKYEKFSFNYYIWNRIQVVVVVVIVPNERYFSAAEKRKTISKFTIAWNRLWQQWLVLHSLEIDTKLIITFTRSVSHLDLI